VQVIDAVTEAAPESDANEDRWLAGDQWALILDGAGRYPGETGGCIHPVTWVVDRLAEHIGKGLDARPGDALPDIVRDAIAATGQDHGTTCDLSDPLSPGAAGALVRHTGSHVEWLVLADCAVILESPEQDCVAIIDDRVDQLPSAPVTNSTVRTYVPDFVRTVRNRPGGFWVLGAVPEAANHALTGSVPASGVRRILLCSDGVSRLTERYKWQWGDVFARFEDGGARSLIDAVREAEISDPEPSRWRGKRHDDATAVMINPRL